MVSVIQAFRGKSPKIASSSFISEKALIIGDVEIGAKSSVWPNAVIRGDTQPIRIGESTSIQDNVVIHTSHDYKVPLRIGNKVSIGHSAVLHGCEIGDHSLIGIHAVILDKTKIGSWVIVGAGAVITSNIDIPSKSLVVGVPGKVVRKLTDADLEYIKNNAERYVRLAESYKKMARS